MSPVKHRQIGEPTIDQLVRNHELEDQAAWLREHPDGSPWEWVVLLVIAVFFTIGLVWTLVQAAPVIAWWTS